MAMQKAAVLTEALPYIQDFSGSTVLVKVGGSVMENEANLVSLLSDISFIFEVIHKPLFRGSRGSSHPT